MKKIPRMILGCTLAAALALTACSRSDSGSSGSMSTNMGGSSSQTGQAGQNAAYRTGLGILTEASDQERAGKIDTIAAAVLLDAEGRVADVMLDEVEISVTGDSTGKVTMPTDNRTKRQKGDDYPLAAVSSLKKGWAEQADAFGNYLTGKTPDEVKKLATDDDGKPKDADLLSTISLLQSTADVHIGFFGWTAIGMLWCAPARMQRQSARPAATALCWACQCAMTPRN